MKELIIYFLLVFFAYVQSLAPATCTNKYDQNTTLPQNCSNNVCNFQSLIPLINGTNPTNQSVFALCIILPTFQIIIASNQLDSIPYSIYIECLQFSTIYNYSLITHNSLVIKSAIVSLNSFQLSAQTVWIEALQNLQISNNSKFINNSYLSSQCSCSEQNSGNCTFEDSYAFPNLFQVNNVSVDRININAFLQQVSFQQITFNSIILFSPQLINIESSQLSSSVVGLFSTQIQILNSTLQTTGNGFSSNNGYGCGYFDQILNQLLGCSGSGGSYGGFGGNSYPDNCALMISRTPYGSSTYPSSPGSGGGFFLSNIKDVSSGGGIINMQAQNITIQSSIIQSNGKDGKQGGGGGSGGTVSIEYSNIFGSGSITANGGSGKSSGGGGKIRIWNHNWKTSNQGSSPLFNFSIAAMGGQQCSANQGISCGQQGTILSSPCMPGFQLNLNTFSCDSCKPGFYQSLYGYSSCLPCSNKPENSFYVGAVSHQIYAGACLFECTQEYNNTIDGKCLSDFQKIMKNMGGMNTLISLGIIVGVSIAYLIIILIQKLTAKEYFLFQQRKNQDQYERKMHFKVQDIPYHQLRIYLSGSNCLQKPWYIPQQTKRAFQKVVSHPITKISSLINKTFKQVNEIGQYSRFQKLTIYFLYVYYYPMAFYILNKLKEHRSLQIYKSIIQINKKIPEFQTLGIKFHVQPYHSVGCIQIFNYTKSALDFYIQNYFPIYFQIEKLPMGGYTIDLNDPFMKAFIMEIDQKSQKKTYQKFIIELDQLLRNSKQLVPILKHLWMMSQHEPNIQVYLYQPSEKEDEANGNGQGRVLGVNKQINIDNKSPLFLVFSSENIDTHHFVYQTDLDCIFYDKVNHFKHQFNFRREVIQDDKKAIFWEIQNQFSQKILSWALGVLTIILLLQCVMSFFMIIFILAEQNVKFNYAIFVYFLLAPFNQFFMVFMNFKLILSKNPKIISYSIYFTLANIIKFFSLAIMALFQSINVGFQNILISILFYLWIISVICNFASLFLQLLLHPHYSKHNSQEKHVWIKND